MRIVCVGGGPAGLYSAISLRLRRPLDDLVVVERRPRGTTGGWGVVFWDDLLDELRRNDPVTEERVRAAAISWRGQEVRNGDAVAYLGGYGYSIGRGTLLEILVERARELGVVIQFGNDIARPETIENADLVVVAEGARSSTRTRHSASFGTTDDAGHNKYLWLGSSKPFDSFTFAFERTAAGWIWFHAYPYEPGRSAVIVECPPATFTGLGLDRMSGTQSAALLRGIFAQHLGVHPLTVHTEATATSSWSSFRHVSNERWRHGKVVLVGDAAHTTHFSIGSGTKAALMDAVALAEELHRLDAVDPALEAYERRRRRDLRSLQTAGRRSAQWFEETEQWDLNSIVNFAWALRERREKLPRWRYALHLATQVVAIRELRRHVGAQLRSARTRTGRR